MPKLQPTKSTSRRNGKVSPATTIRHLRARIKQLVHDVERYRTALIKHLPPPPKHLRMTRKQMREAEANPFTLKDFVRETEAMLKSST